MIEARPFASLSSGLLARKGGAKPAMRPQAWGQLGSGIEDLGWNDMGSAAAARSAAQVQSVEDHDPAPVAALTPMADVSEPMAEFEPAPPVVEQQRAAIAASFAAPASAPKASPKAEARVSAKTAFTLRLEAERHLKLRLACAVSGRSAQQLLTEALDQLLQSRPEIDALADQVPGNARKPR